MSCAQMALLFTHLSPERSWARRNLIKTKMPSIMVFGSLEEVSALKCSTSSQLNIKVLSRREKNWALCCPCKKFTLEYNPTYILKTVTWVILLSTYRWRTSRSSKKTAIFFKPRHLSCFSTNLCSNRNMMNEREKKAFWFQLIATLMFWRSVHFSGLICNLWDQGCVFSKRFLSSK